LLSDNEIERLASRSLKLCSIDAAIVEKVWFESLAVVNEHMLRGFENVDNHRPVHAA
jgi:hypothetical protein